MLLLILLVLFVISYYYFVKKKLNYWNERNVPNLGPLTPLGDLSACLLQRKNLYYLLRDLYLHFKSKGCKYFGYYFTLGPVFMPIDMDLIKRILVTDFDYFSDRGIDTDKEKIPLGESLFAQPKKRWKYLRDKTVPFLTPTKLKLTAPIIDEYIKDFCKILDDNEGTDIDIHEITERYILDVACNYFLGVDNKHLKENNSPVIFVARETGIAKISNLLRVIWRFGVTNPANMYHGIFYNKNFTDFWFDYTKKYLDLRKSNNSLRNDLLNEYIKLCENENEEFDFLDLSASMLMLIAATFESTTLLVSHLLYELAKRPDYQNRLREDIKDLYHKADGNITFDDINNMYFLECLVIETLRRHTIFATITRRCVKDYKVPEYDLIIEKDTIVTLPFIGINLDPEIFPNPYEFNPDRFLNNDSRQNVIAFSIGPKQCPGQRFASILSKNLIVNIMKRYEIKLNPKTGDLLETSAFSRHVLHKYKNKILLEFYKKPLNI